MYPRIRVATHDDVPGILRIAHQYRNELGYVHPVALREHIARHTVLVAVQDNNLLGFVDYHSRRDGWQTVYHLATDRAHTAQGVGRQLLYAVPCPIRLKVTADNPANQFYAGAGMQLVASEPGKRQPLNIYELRVLYVLVKGGVPQLPDIARATGMAYGVRGDYKAYSWPFMVDVDFESFLSGALIWSDYLSQIRVCNPVQAMVVDYGQHQPSRDVLYQQINDLRMMGITRIMVCPKFEGAFADIPPDCIIALSVPSKMAGWLPNDYGVLRGRKVHLLGGEVERQRRVAALVTQAGGTVISMDGNSHTKAAAFGRLYTGNRWIQTTGRTSFDLIAESGANIRASVQHPHEQLVLPFEPDTPRN